TPAIAMLSYSNFGSANNHTSRKVKEAIDILHETCPDLVIDGELQANFALNPTLLKEKFPFSKLVGKNVNALIFPNLDSANINYKLLKELDEADSIGPVIMGLTKPAHILQLGASVDEIVNMTALAVVDAQNKETAAE
ncbi:MAG: phosphate acyltransferase, partial [Flavobacteriales bacterium]